MVITNVEELIEKNKIKTYECGSQRLSHAIRTKLNMVPIDIYTHRTTGKIVNVYVMTDELSRFLRDWTKNNPKKSKEVSNG